MWPKAFPMAPELRRQPLSCWCQELQVGLFTVISLGLDETLSLETRNLLRNSVNIPSPKLSNQWLDTSSSRRLMYSWRISAPARLQIRLRSLPRRLDPRGVFLSPSRFVVVDNYKANASNVSRSGFRISLWIISLDEARIHSCTSEKDACRYPYQGGPCE